MGLGLRISGHTAPETIAALNERFPSGRDQASPADFIVSPAADPSQIGLEFAGATPTLGPDGSLVLTFNGPLLTLRKPVIYQTIAG